MVVFRAQNYPQQLAKDPGTAALSSPSGPVVVSGGTE
jgi:hypothetical protein